MKIGLDCRKGAQENAGDYFSRSKELAAKEEGARKAIAETREALERALGESRAADGKKSQPAMRRKREWYEKYRWFFTSGGRLVVAGRDAKQNDALVGKLMAEADLFFHADIQGAPATILVDGKMAGEQEKKEAAQFAASHSSAWKVGAASVDVYAVERGQLSKHAQGGFVGQGGFAISGEREWFRATPLGLAIGEKEGAALCLPAIHPKAGAARFTIGIGNYEKGQAASIISKSLKVSADELLLALPSGRFSLKEKK